MKAPKLPRSKTNDNFSRSTDSLSSRDTPEVTLKASFEDLRRPDGRELLRQHFTGAFPETHRKQSHSSLDSYDMGKPRLLRTGSNLSVPQNESSESSLSVNSVGLKRLSTVQESNSAIDVEQAIRLLQELKKNASPEELVALHKALLPTRDSVAGSPSLPVNEDRSSIVSSATLIRHRSMLPPGLATRGGASEDLLRRQEDNPPTRKSRKSKYDGWSSPLSQPASYASLAALDLAEEPSGPGPTTPSDDEYSQTGVYRHGTLRIMNGAASPEPSISGALRRSLDAHTFDRTTGDLVPKRANLRQLDQRTSQEYRTAPTTPVDPVSVELKQSQTSYREDASVALPKNSAEPEQSSDEDLLSNDQAQTAANPQSRPRGSSISGIPVPLNRDESSPRTYKRHRAQRSRDKSRERSETNLVSPKESSQSLIPLRVETKLSRPSLTTLEPQVSKLSLTPIRPEIDDGRVSPVGTDLPRFAQRWSHRASKISEDAECDVSATPYENRGTLSQYEHRTSLLRRLSTVHDSEANDADASALETPDVALSRLNGIQIDRTVLQTIDTTPTKGSEAATSSPQFRISTRFDRPMVLQHSDSGYGTDASLQSLLQKTSGEAGGTNPVHPLANEGDSLEEGDEDAKSLYTFDQILRSPSLLQGLSLPSSRPTNGKKKHSSFLGISTTRRDTLKTVASPIDAISPRQVEDNSPMERKNSKKKKLQKQMPASVRKEKKAQMAKMKESGSPEVGASSTSLPQSETASSHPRFSFEGLKSPEGPVSTPASASELQGDVQPPPVELGGETNVAPAERDTATSKFSFSRRRSKSRGRERSRSNSIQLPTNHSDIGYPPIPDPRNRSKSATRSGNTTPKQTTFDLNSISCMNGSASATNDNESEEVPLWTDHASVSRALGGSPYDLSTNLFRRTVSVPGAVMHEIQSPHQITTGLSRTKSGTLRGMDSGMASELARMKSRDVAIKNNEEVYDRPRMAKPRSRGEDKVENEPTRRAPFMIEDRFPGRKIRSRSLGPGNEPAELSARPLSTYSESIPPMPELPANVQIKALRVNEIVSKRLKDSASSTPTASAQLNERPGDSSLSVAEAVRKALESRSVPEPKQDGGDRKSSRSRSRGPRRTKHEILRTQPLEISSSDSDEAIRPTLTTKVVSRNDGRSFSSNHVVQPSGSTGWEEQAKLWRERRRSIGQSLGKPPAAEHEMPTKVDTSSPDSSSPDIVVSNLNKSPHRSIDSATQHADAYRDLIEEDSSANHEESYTVHTVTQVTVHQHNEKRSMSQSTSTLLVQSPLADGAKIERSRSPGGRVITPSGNFHPYTPADAAQAEKSRAESLAKLTGATVRRSTESDIKAKSTYRSENTIEALFDRYGGGFQYNYERGVGVGGSAGVRARSDKAKRKSKELSRGLGLDLSDVPYREMLQQPA